MKRQRARLVDVANRQIPAPDERSRIAPGPAATRFGRVIGGRTAKLIEPGLALHLPITGARPW